MTRALCVLLLACSACAGAPTPAPKPPKPVVVAPTEPEVPAPDWALGAWPAHLPKTEFAAAVATSTDAATARTRANSALEVRLFGPRERRPFDALPPQLGPVSTPALTRMFEVDGITSVLVARSRTEGSQSLRSWAETLRPEAPLPASTSKDEGILVFGTELARPRQHMDLLVAHLHHQQAAHFACVQAPVRTSTCTAPNPRLLQDALQTFLSGVQVSAIPPDGVPYRPGMGPLRPATVRVTWTSPGQAPIPLPSMPLRLRVAGQHTKALTDSKGYLRWPLPTTMQSQDTVEVSVDTQALLGRLQSLWSPAPTLRVSLRTLHPDQSRLALSIQESAIGQPSTEGTESLRHRLQEGGLNTVYYLDEGRAPKLPIQASALGALADQAMGQLDLIAVGVLQSHFASQMGARSVWYEASGHLTIYDAWTGQKIAHFEDSARAMAIGESAAAAAALVALGRKLAQHSQQAIHAYSPGPLLQ